MNPTKAGRDASQLDDFSRWRESARHVEESSAETEGAVFHALLDQRAHLIQLFARRFPIDVANRKPTREELDKMRALRSEEHTSELQSLAYLVCRLLLEKK